MSDGQQPTFFGGMPPRGTATLTERPRERSGVEQAPGERLNTMALVALIGSFVVSLVGVVCGLIALRQIKDTEQRGRGFALAGLTVGLIGLALTLVAASILILGGPSLVKTMTTFDSGKGSSSETFPTQAPVSKQEAAKAKAAIASGGGAIPGHIVSAELCTAIGVFQTATGGQAASTSVTPEQLAAMEGLAAVASPNQKVYERFVAMTKDPASVTDIATAQGIAADFAKAVQVDVSTCA